MEAKTKPNHQEKDGGSSHIQVHVIYTTEAGKTHTKRMVALPTSTFFARIVGQTSARQNQKKGIEQKGMMWMALGSPSPYIYIYIKTSKYIYIYIDIGHIL